MLTIVTVSISLFFIVLTGWTLTTYFVKKDSQKVLREELKNLLNIGKKLLVSLKNLIGILANNSLSSESNEANAIEENILEEDQKPLSVVQPIKEIKDQSVKVRQNEDDDDALSSFSPEVVEVINEEEKKVA